VKLRAIIALLAVAAFVWPMADVEAQSGQVVTPTASYSDPAWRDTATSAQADLSAMEQEIGAIFGKDQLVFVTTAESAGGIGFWPNPTGDPSKRYLCVLVKAVVRPPGTGCPWADDKMGRFSNVWDFYAKPFVDHPQLLGVINKYLAKVNNPNLLGGGIIMIYSKKPITDPAFYQTGESYALFMSKSNIALYCQYRLKNQDLFSQSEFFGILEGQDQISTLLTLIHP
jgi:hypothetical protein